MSCVGGCRYGLGEFCPGHHHPALCRDGFEAMCRKLATADAATMAAARAHPARNAQPIAYRQTPAHPTARPGPVPAWRLGRLSRELVVSRYREDVRWTAAIPFRVWLYNKGEPLPYLGPHVVVIDRPNTGREAETWMHHLATHYDVLPDLTFTAQGDPFSHSPDFYARLQHDYTAPTSLTPHYTTASPSNEIKAHDRIETHFGHEVRYGDATIGGSSGLRPGAWFNPAAWSHVFACPLKFPLHFGYAAMWAIPRAAVRSRPRAFWTTLRDEIQEATTTTTWTDPPINPWTLEAMLGACLGWPRAFPHRVRWASDPPAPPITPRGSQTAQRGAVAVSRLDAARACDYRQPLSVPEQSACGCGGRGVAVCLAGRSRRDDHRVTLGECVACGGPNQS
jgi:hypothetical protein